MKNIQSDILKDEAHMRKIITALLLLPAVCIAQINITNFSATIPNLKTYSDAVYKPYIQTTMLYNRNKQNSLPLITLSAFEQLLLCFDDLEGGVKNYYYSVELCNVNWGPSNLSPLSYLADFTQSRISRYRFSFNTKQKYTYYEALFPNAEIRPTKSGNYLLKVFEDGDESRLILTRRFYVLDNQAAVSLMHTTNAFNDYQRKQQVNFLADVIGLNVTDPFSQVKAIVMQNARNDIQQSPQSPMFVNQNRLRYNGMNNDVFWGGNEFRYFDCSSLRLLGWNVSSLQTKDTANAVTLSTDKPLANQPYIRRLDHDGHFYISNEDGTDSRTDADYSIINFRLQLPELPAGKKIFIVGQFNNWRLHKNHQLHFNTSSNQYEGALYLKQGIYDYKYTVVNENDGSIDESLVDGSFSQAENNYQIFYYYKKFGDLYDQLLGFYEFNTLNSGW